MLPSVAVRCFTSWPIPHHNCVGASCTYARMEWSISTLSHQRSFCGVQPVVTGESYVRPRVPGAVAFPTNLPQLPRSSPQVSTDFHQSTLPQRSCLHHTINMRNARHPTLWRLEIYWSRKYWVVFFVHGVIMFCSPPCVGTQASYLTSFVVTATLYGSIL